MFAVVLGLVAIWSFRPPPTREAMLPIAVLPFVNMSTDSGQEFFSDGLTEEIVTALAKIPSLSVVGRASAFQLKNEHVDSRTAGKVLGVRYLVEGSVRKSGERVRITAQLVNTDTGLSIWTETYDRELQDIFETQSQIAESIAGALQLTFADGTVRKLVSNRTSDLTSYQEYLRARTLYRTRNIHDVLGILEPLVVRDGNFAPAWSLLAQAYFILPLYGFADSNAQARGVFEKAEASARTAIRLDPTNAPAYSVLADLDYTRGYWTKGEDGFRKAIELDPNDPDILNRFSARLTTSGRVKEALNLGERVRTLEPFMPSYNVTTARVMVTAGQFQSAIALLEKTSADGPVGYYRNLYLARAYAAAGRYDAAEQTLRATPPLDGSSHQNFEQAARILHSAPEKASSPAALPAVPGGLNFVYAHVGAWERVLEPLAQRPENGPAYDILWQAEAAPLRKTQRFKKVVDDVGLVQLWRARGWPDLCHPVTGGDFSCD